MNDLRADACRASAAVDHQQPLTGPLLWAADAVAGAVASGWSADGWVAGVQPISK
jgi:hypothetical protein